MSLPSNPARPASSAGSIACSELGGTALKIRVTPSRYDAPPAGCTPFPSSLVRFRLDDVGPEHHGNAVAEAAPSGRHGARAAVARSARFVATSLHGSTSIRIAIGVWASSPSRYAFRGRPWSGAPSQIRSRLFRHHEIELDIAQTAALELIVLLNGTISSTTRRLSATPRTSANAHTGELGWFRVNRSTSWGVLTRMEAVRPRTVSRARPDLHPQPRQPRVVLVELTARWHGAHLPKPRA